MGRRPDWARIIGVEKRARIDFVSDDHPIGKYYYQTHARVEPNSDNFREVMLETHQPIQETA
jgi:hypothetical protein